MAALAALLALGGTLVFVAGCLGLRELGRGRAGTSPVSWPRRFARRTRADAANRAGPVGRFGGPLVFRALPPAWHRRIQRQIEAAGRPGGLTMETYTQRKAVHLVLFGGTALLLALLGARLAALPLLLFGLIAQDIRLARLARVRTSRVDQALPDFLDVLAVVVSAGLAFRAALERVATMLGGALGDEFGAVLREIELGTSRRDAFIALRERTGSERLGQVIAAVLQSEELGVPLADALLEIAADQRRESAQAARRRAAQATPRVSLVVSLVLVPGTMLLLVAAFYYGTSVHVHGLFPSQ